jgi:hypothetical protein
MAAEVVAVTGTDFVQTTDLQKPDQDALREIQEIQIEAQQV